MAELQRLLDLIESITGVVVGSKLRLTSNVKSTSGNIVPKGTVVEVESISPNGDQETITLASIDGEEIQIIVASGKPLTHKIVR